MSKIFFFFSLLVQFAHCQNNSLLTQPLAPVRLNNKWGYINQKGDSVTSFKFSDAREFHNGGAWASINYQYRLINSKGEDSILLDKDIFPKTEFNHRGIAIGSDHSKLFERKEGVFDTTGKWLFPTGEMEIMHLIEDGIIFRRNKKYGMVSYQGDTLLKMEWESLDSAWKGKIIAKKNGKYGLISLDGNEILPFNFDYISKAGPDVLKMEEDGHAYLKDFSLKSIGPQPVLYALQLQSGDPIMVEIEGTGHGFIDLKGNWITKTYYYDCNPFQGKLASFMKMKVDQTNGLVFHGGLMRRNGTEKFSKPNFAIGYQGGKCALLISLDENNQRDKYGLIDTSGIVILQPTYGMITLAAAYDDNEKITKENEGLFLFGANYGYGPIGYLNQSGKQIIPAQYEFLDDIQLPYCGFIAFKQNDLWGFYDRNGNVAIPPKYQEVGHFSK